jgi:hypothetical protein
VQCKGAREKERERQEGQTERAGKGAREKERERQEAQTERAGKERGNAVGMGSGPSMQGRYAH